MTQEEANLYWSTREHKKWVVSLKARKNRLVMATVDGKRTLERANPRCDMYVRARTSAGARETALANLTSGERMDVVSVRLATAFDLSCVQVSAC